MTEATHYQRTAAVRWKRLRIGGLGIVIADTVGGYRTQNSQNPADICSEHANRFE
jgi:hypothetical protein